MKTVAEISVIVPVYKVEPYIRRCVDSILQQSFRDFELILVDDGSPDSCGTICDEYADRDPRIHVIHQKNGGLSAARNAGIDWAFGNSGSQWLTFIDSDDWIHREYLQTLLAAANAAGAGMSVCDPLWTDCVSEDRELPPLEPIVLDAERAIVEHYARHTTAWAKLFRKELFRDIRFPVGKLHEDAFVTHILLFRAGTSAIVPEKLYYYFNNQTSITRSRWTDRKLDSIEAHELRLQYFLEGGYREAYRRQQQIYVEELTDKLMHLTAEGQVPGEFAGTFRMLRAKLQDALKKAKAEGLVPWNGENLWAYLYAMNTEIGWKTLKKLQRFYHNLKK